MPPQPIPAGIQINATKCHYFLGGSFDSASWRLPYLSSNLSIKDAADYLSLASEIPGLDEKDWRIEEMYQRDIDWARVKGQILPYLRDDKAKFFNAITVVIVPKKQVGGVFAASFENGSEWTPPASAQFLFPCEDELVVGPVRFGFFGTVHDERGNLNVKSENMQAGLVTWNRDQVHAIAIDGQHRLAAIKEMAGNAGADQESLNSKVPVLFLIFHPEFGYRAPGDQDTVKLLRSVFIDLNKHAQPVNRARNILLDDRDPQALCVRALLAETMESDMEGILKEPPYLPLSVVDWHSEQAKFNEGPFISTVLGLDWLVMKVLGVRDIKSYTDFGTVKRQIVQLQKSLKIDLSNALNRIANLEEFAQTPFSYEEEELAAIVGAFRKVYAKPLVAILTQYSPYKALIELRKVQKSLRIEWQHWYRLAENERSGEEKALVEALAYKNELAQRQPPINTTAFQNDVEAIENLKKDSLAYAVVFQKAIVEAFVDFSKLERESILQLALEGPGYTKDVEANYDYSDEDAYFSDENLENDLDYESLVEDEVFATGTEASRVLALCEEYLPSLDGIFNHQTGLLAVTFSFEDADGTNCYFWQGSLLKIGGTIDFTQAAVTRAKDLIFASVLLAKIKSVPGRKTDYDSFDDLWDEINDPNATLPKLVKRFALKVNQLAHTSSVGGMILAHDDIDWVKDKAMDHVRARMKTVWDFIA